MRNLRTSETLIVTAMLAGLTLTSGAFADETPPCATVKAGNVVVPGYDCLNTQLSAQSKAAADRAAQQENIARDNASIAVASPDKVGDQTPAGAKLRFGQNFGVSPEPYRPPSVPSAAPGVR